MNTIGGAVDVCLRRDWFERNSFTPFDDACPPSDPISQGKTKLQNDDDGGTAALRRDVHVAAGACAVQGIGAGDLSTGDSSFR